MKSLSTTLLLVALSTVTPRTQAPPVRALFVTGGCCHDYDAQKQILTEGISARTKLKIDWTIVHQGGKTTNTKIPLYEKKDWAKGYDVVVHDECFAKVTDPKWTERILKPHREGVPAVVLHCAAHCYRDKTDEWFKFIGVTSHRHGSKYSFDAVNLQPAHPVMKGLGPKWRTPNGELYLISKIWPDTTPLMHAMSKNTKRNEVCVWTSRYGKGPVFGTTIGHHNETVKSSEYLNMVTRGMLWVAGRLDEKIIKATPPQEPTEKVEAPPAKKKKAGRAKKKGKTPPVEKGSGGKEIKKTGPVSPVKSEAAALVGARAPPGFKLEVFASPPDISYPVSLCATPEGIVFVAVDGNSSLDRAADRGRIIRCVDHDDDGRADQFTTFAKVDSPRGLSWDGEALYVVHPPDLSLFRDRDGDGTAEEHRVLVRGIGRDLKFRGADHTTNGLRMGIDGWLYIAVGDYGFLDARGTDGKSLRMRGGGIVRVRPDGSGLEVFVCGLRNICDVALDSSLNAFTRDNTNDGGGWNVRLHHVFATAHCGYPSLYKHFSDEIVAPLADYGGGSGTGALWLDEPSLPRPHGSALYTCDWVRNKIYRHPLQPEGASFAAKQETFLDLPRPTDIDVDGRGRLYVSSWKGGKYHNVGPNVGQILRLSAEEDPAAFPALPEANTAELVGFIGGHGQTLRLHAQRELLRRTETVEAVDLLENMVEGDGPLAGRVAALFTLKQMRGEASHDSLLGWLAYDDLREFALRALADHGNELAGVSVAPFLAALTDKNPRVRLQAVIGLGRLERVDVADSILPLTTAADPAIAHAAVKALVGLSASETCLAALGGEFQGGALRALKSMHEPAVVSGLIDHLDSSRDPDQGTLLLGALIRLYHREGEWTGRWWGTRPDTSGPYYKRSTWASSMSIERAIERELEYASDAQALSIFEELRRHRVSLPIAMERLLFLAGDKKAFRELAVESLLAQAKLEEDAVDFLGLVATSHDSESALRAKAAGALLKAAHNNKQPVQTKRAAERAVASAWGQPAVAAVLLQAIGRGGLKSWADEVKSRLADSNVEVKEAANFAATKLKLDESSKAPPVGKEGQMIGSLPRERVVKRLKTVKGEVKLGRELFAAKTCSACHTTSSEEEPKGPFLGDIAKRYGRDELVESILEPGAQVAQGFATQLFTLENGSAHMGFVTKEAADEIELRNAAGVVVVLDRSKIRKRQQLDNSLMPEGLVKDLTVKELASLLAYLESLGG